jgi:Domain of unknown function (DUF4406)/Domain of unknown function (DUF6378)
MPTYPSGPTGACVVHVPSALGTIDARTWSPTVPRYGLTDNETKGEVLDSTPYRPCPDCLFIAGKMTGVEAFNFPAFFDAEERWAEAGWLVTNPARMDTDLGFDPVNHAADTPEAYMKRDLPQVAACDAIALIPGWETSSGCAKELQVARWCGLEVYDATTMELLPEETILEEAQRLVFGPRQAAYGHPLDDFTRTGRIWGAVLGIDDVPAEKVALCMVGLKVSREVNMPGRDNRVDGGGYWGTLELVHQRRELQRLGLA